MKIIILVRQIFFTNYQFRLGFSFRPILLTHEDIYNESFMIFYLFISLFNRSVKFVTVFVS